MNDYSLIAQELSDLQVLHREMTEKRHADCINAIILLNSGWSSSQIAQVLYYETFKKIKQTCENSFEDAERYLLSLHALLTENF